MCQNEISVIILAAGNGTRMKSNKAKVLHEICGEAMIAHVLKKAYSITNNVKVVLGYQFNEVKNAICENFTKVEIYKQDTQNFPGTAGAVMAATNSLQTKKTLVMCADMPLVSVNELIELSKNNAHVTLSAFYAEDPFGYGRVVKNGENVIKIVEQKDASEEEKQINLCNGGTYCFDTDFLKKAIFSITNDNASGEYYLTDIISIANKEGKKVSYNIVNQDNFIGINDKFALSVAENKMQNEIKKNLMKNGVIMRLADSIFIDSRAKFQGECEIEPNVVILGDCFIKDSIIKSGSVVEFSQIIDSSVGPMAHIRPKSKINKTHIGNFVELKSAILNEVKAGHLSYLGDCEIQSGTNVGCGTITCNYDGKQKHKTIIGKNVFIGSDTQLIAPLNLADNTIIAAGSTVTKGSENGDLIISRTKQINKPGFFYKFFEKKDNEK